MLGESLSMITWVCNQCPNPDSCIGHCPSCNSNRIGGGGANGMFCVACNHSWGGYAVENRVVIRHCGDEYDGLIAEIVTVGKIQPAERSICPMMDSFDLRLPNGEVEVFCSHEFTLLE